MLRIFETWLLLWPLASLIMLWTPYAQKLKWPEDMWASVMAGFMLCFVGICIHFAYWLWT